MDYLLIAEDWHCPPWELFERRTPKAFWLACMQHLRYARNVVRHKQETEDTKAVAEVKKKVGKATS